MAIKADNKPDKKADRKADSRASRRPKEPAVPDRGESVSTMEPTVISQSSKRRAELSDKLDPE